MALKELSLPLNHSDARSNIPVSNATTSDYLYHDESTEQAQNSVPVPWDNHWVLARSISVFFFVFFTVFSEAFFSPGHRFCLRAGPTGERH